MGMVKLDCATESMYVPFHFSEGTTSTWTLSASSIQKSHHARTSSIWISLGAICKMKSRTQKVRKMGQLISYEPVLQGYEISNWNSIADADGSSCSQKRTWNCINLIKTRDRRDNMTSWQLRLYCEESIRLGLHKGTANCTLKNSAAHFWNSICWACSGSYQLRKFCSHLNEVASSAVLEAFDHFPTSNSDNWTSATAYEIKSKLGATGSHIEPWRGSGRAWGARARRRPAPGAAREPSPGSAPRRPSGRRSRPPASAPDVRPSPQLPRPRPAGEAAQQRRRAGPTLLRSGARSPPCEEACARAVCLLGRPACRSGLWPARTCCCALLETEFLAWRCRLCRHARGQVGACFFFFLTLGHVWELATPLIRSRLAVAEACLTLTLRVSEHGRTEQQGRRVGLRNGPKKHGLP